MDSQKLGLEIVPLSSLHNFHSGTILSPLKTTYYFAMTCFYIHFSPDLSIHDYYIIHLVTIKLSSNFINYKVKKLMIIP